MGFLERFARIVAQHGSRPAISCAGGVMSYAELDRRARSAAGGLRALGVGAESIVALTMPRSPEWVVSILGTWMAGGAFVPIDPAYPEARRRFLLEDCGARVVLDRDLPSGAGDVVPYDPARLAYVIYTSGSSGRPKGVMIEHAGIAGFLGAQIEAFRVGPESRVLPYVSIGFDASLSELGTALLSGACLHLEARLQSIDDLVSVLEAERITHVCLTPSVLARVDPARAPPSLETVITGGEVCPPAVVRAWSARVRLINVYGPTEATVCSSLSVCTPAWSRALIGRPMPGVQLSIVDEDLQPVPQGRAGELLISGAQLARGYLGRPELTAAKLVDLPAGRAYRTGDLAVEHADGEIEFLGRVDRQVKVRGLLVEPEEIERRLLEHPGVRAAAVVKRDGRLVAFVSLVAEVRFAPRALRLHLAGSLPAWMVPERFVVLDALPLTPNEKVDLEALSTMALATSRGHLVPSTPEEVLLAELWAEVLGVEVAADDDFFELGGDSFAALEVAARAERRGLALQPSLLVRHPTIRGALAALREVPGGLDSDAADAACLDREAQLDDLEAAFEALRASARDLEPALEDLGSARDLEPAPEKLGSAWDLEPALEDLGSARDLEPALEDLGSARDLEPAPEDLGSAHASSGAVLVTGATGSLGSRLVPLLLARGLDVVCLARARDDAAATARAGARAIAGDSSKPRFGLPEARWRALAAEVSTVFHLAAEVSLLSPYSVLVPVNVAGTREVLRFAATGRAKVLHYASTLSVFVATDRNHGTLLETDRLDATRTVHGGYAQTKWVAERLVSRAFDAGLTGTILRFGLITGGTSTDFLSTFVRGIARLGAAPDTAGLAVDVTPVDYAARAMVHLADRLARTPYHLANPRALPLEHLLDAIAARVPLDRLPPDRWLARVRPGRTESAAVLALCRCLEGFDRNRTMDLFQATGVVFDQTHTRAALAGVLTCPAPESVIHTYVERALAEER